MKDLKSGITTFFINGNTLYADEGNTIEIGQISADGNHINLWSNHNKDTYCIFCGTLITEKNGGSIEFTGINKLDRSKMERLNEVDQKLNNICSACILGIYRMVWAEFKSSKEMEKVANEEKRRKQVSCTH